MEKNNSRVCVICNKCFSSGKAIGGHMRSHFVKLPIPPKPEPKNQALDNSTELTHSPIHSSSLLNFLPKKKTTQNSPSLKRNSFVACFPGENILLPYPNIPTRKRSKICRRSITAAGKNAEPKQASSECETLPKEEAARTLMTFTSDKWTESKEIKTEEMEEASKMEAKDDLTQARFKCEMCPKVFRSAQGLGGHRAMHRRNQNLSQEGSGSVNILDGVEQNVIKCPYCSNVFKSAQSLGGHKKRHLHNPMVAEANTTADIFNPMVAEANTTADIFSDELLDLNFPAPGEYEEVGQIEFSTMTSRDE